MGKTQKKEVIVKVVATPAVKDAVKDFMVKKWEECGGDKLELPLWSNFKINKWELLKKVLKIPQGSTLIVEDNAFKTLKRLVQDFIANREKGRAIRTTKKGPAAKPQKKGVTYLTF